MSCGSNAATDYLLSNGSMDIVHEGAGFCRSEKVALILENSWVIPSLQICWSGKERFKNCGACEKCIRTRLNFIACGMKNPSCFELPFSPKMIDSLFVINADQLYELHSIAEFARNRGVKTQWLKKLNKRIQFLKKLLFGVQAAISPLNQWLIRIKNLRLRGTRNLKRRLLARAKPL